jgi:hypothetical protein
MKIPAPDASTRLHSPASAALFRRVNPVFQAAKCAPSVAKKQVIAELTGNLHGAMGGKKLVLAFCKGLIDARWLRRR